MRRSTQTLSIAVTMLIASQSSAIAQPIELTIAHLYADNHYLSEQAIKPWAEQVEDRTGGAVEFTIYPAAQLGKSQVSIVESGLADIALLVPSAEPEKLPLYSVLELPYLYDTSCEAAAKLWAVAQPGGVLSESEVKPLGVRTLFVTALPPYAILTASRKIEKLEDVAGLKLRGNGLGASEVVRALGAVPIQIGSGEIYDGVSRGTVDGVFFPYTGIEPYDLQNVLKYGIDGLQLGGAGNNLTIREATWSQLPDDVKRVMEEVSAEIQQHMCEWYDEQDEQIRNWLVEDQGLEISAISPEEDARLEEAMQPVFDTWVGKMEGAGKNGEAVLEAFRAAGPTN